MSIENVIRGFGSRLSIYTEKGPVLSGDLKPSIEVVYQILEKTIQTVTGGLNKALWTSIAPLTVFGCFIVVGGGMSPCIFESLPFPDAVSDFPVNNEKNPKKHGNTPQKVPVSGKKSPALTKMDLAFECGLFPPGRAGNHHAFCVDEG